MPGPAEALTPGRHPALSPDGCRRSATFRSGRRSQMRDRCSVRTPGWGRTRRGRDVHHPSRAARRRGRGHGLVRRRERRRPGRRAGAVGRTPTIVVIVADDMRFDFRKVADQPRRELDRLHGGVDRDAAVRPARAGLFRGTYSYRTGVTNNATTYKMPDNDTIATRIKSAGYRTVLIGKYLNDYPWTKGRTYVPPGWDGWYAAGSSSWKPGARHTTDYVFGLAASQVRATPATTPLFLYLGPQAPHLPATPPAALRQQPGHAPGQAALVQRGRRHRQAAARQRGAAARPRPSWPRSRSTGSTSAARSSASTRASRRSSPRWPTPVGWPARRCSSPATTATCSASTDCSRRASRTRSRAASRSWSAGRASPGGPSRGSSARSTSRPPCARWPVRRAPSTDGVDLSPLLSSGTAGARRGLHRGRRARRGTRCAPRSTSTSSTRTAAGRSTTSPPTPTRWRTGRTIPRTRPLGPRWPPGWPPSSF